MAQLDLNIYRAARTEILAGMGGSLMCRTIIWMTDEIADNHEDEFDIDRMIEGLERLQDYANVMVREIKRQRVAAERNMARLKGLSDANPK